MRSSAPPLVLLASPSAEVRSRWSEALQGAAVIQEVAERSELEHSMATRQPALVLLDLSLPPLDGVGVVPALQRLSARTKIVLLTSAPNDREGISALRAGARGYCEMETPPFLLKKAVEMVRKGEIWVSRRLIHHLLEELKATTERRLNESTKSDRRLDRLTPRQREIARLVGRGASNKEIATRLDITDKTVKAHLSAIFRKLGRGDRLRLALYVAEHEQETR